MRNHKAAALASALICALPGVVAAADLSPVEIGAELVGRPIAWWEDGGWQGGFLMLLPSGAAELTVDRPARRADTGTWSLRDGQICTIWRDLRPGAEKCYRVRRAGDGRFLTTGGNVFEVRQAGA